MVSDIGHTRRTVIATTRPVLIVAQVVRASVYSVIEVTTIGEDPVSPPPIADPE